MTCTPGPWIINGQASIGWRIDTMNPNTKSGVEFLLNPVAIVLKKEDAHLVANTPEFLDLLNEWLDTPFFETKDEWRNWVDDYRPRVESAIAEGMRND